MPFAPRDLLGTRRVCCREVEDVGKIGRREARLVPFFGRTKKRPFGIDLLRPVPGRLEMFSPRLFVRGTGGVVYIAGGGCSRTGRRSHGRIEEGRNASSAGRGRGDKHEQTARAVGFSGQRCRRGASSFSLIPLTPVLIGSEHWQATHSTPLVPLHVGMATALVYVAHRARI